MRVVIVANPEAGRGRAVAMAENARATLEASGATIELIAEHDPATSEARLAPMVAEHPDRVLAVGGDGLVHHVVQVLAGSTVPLAVLPAGSGNDAVRGLGSLRQVERLLDLDPQPIDLLKVGHRYVVSVATTGFSAAVSDRGRSLRWPRGGTRYTLATLLELPRLANDALDVVVDDERHRFDATLVAVANTPWFGGGMAICPEARADDGVADVTVIDAVGRFRLLRSFGKVFSGCHLTDPHVRSFRGRTIRLEPRGGAELAVWGDGEPIGEAPVTIETAPGALLVVTDDER